MRNARSSIGFELTLPAAALVLLSAVAFNGGRRHDAEVEVRGGSEAGLRHDPEDGDEDGTDGKAD